MIPCKRVLRELPSGAPTHPPDLDSIVADLGIELRYIKSRAGFNGATDLSGPRPVVELGWVPASRSRSVLPWEPGVRLADLQPHQYDARTRFTLAHEIGHVLVHRLAAHSDAPSRLDRAALERACDAVAAELLMPTDWFLSQIDHDPTIANLRRVSMRAGVSISAALIRARGLRLGVAAVFLAQTADKDWRVRRVYGINVRNAFERDCADHAALTAAPLKSINTWQMPFSCGQHVHVLRGELRRTFLSAVMVGATIDGHRVPAPTTWRCAPSKPRHR